jgi:hypothetical protein
MNPPYNYLCICLSFYLPIIYHLSVSHLSSIIYLSFSINHLLSIYLSSIYLSIFPFISIVYVCMYICMYVCIYPLISIYLLTSILSLSLYLSIYLSIDLHISIIKSPGPCRIETRAVTIASFHLPEFLCHHILPRDSWDLSRWHPSPCHCPSWPSTPTFTSSVAWPSKGGFQIHSMRYKLETGSPCSCSIIPA